MSNWDISTPDGNAIRAQGPARIREAKEALQNALRGGAAEGIEAVFPGPNPLTNPIFHYRGRKGTTAERPAAGNYGFYFDSDRNSLQRDNGSTWDDILSNITAGKHMLFFQAVAPVGWVKETDTDGRIPRVTDGVPYYVYPDPVPYNVGGSIGGSFDISNPIPLAHSHATSPHYHDTPVGVVNNFYRLAHPNGLFPSPGSLSESWGVLSSGGSDPVSTVPSIRTLPTSPGTDSKLSDVSLAYINVLNCRKL
jgi:hypothetical protein